MCKIIGDWLASYFGCHKPQKMMFVQEGGDSIIFKAFDTAGEEINVETKFIEKNLFKVKNENNV